jgi:hypothetical protein
MLTAAITAKIATTAGVPILPDRLSWSASRDHLDCFDRRRALLENAPRMRDRRIEAAWEMIDDRTLEDIGVTRYEIEHARDARHWSDDTVVGRPCAEVSPQISGLPVATVTDRIS